MTMRANRVVAMSAALCALLAAEARAAEPAGFYLRGDVGASFGRDFGGSVAGGDGFEGDGGTAPLFELGAGYQLGNGVRLEVTGGYRPSFEIASREAIGSLPVNADADLDSWTVMANAYYDIDTGSAFTPYLGGGIGLAVHRLGTVSYAIGGGRIEESSNTNTSFAWSLMGGVAYRISETLQADLGYRYLDAGNFETSGSTTVGNTSKVEGDVRAHEIKVGLRYRF